MNKNKINWIAVLTMIFLFGMVAFVTNLAAPIGVIWKYQPGIEGSNTWGMMGNMMNLPAGRPMKRYARNFIMLPIMPQVLEPSIPG